MKEDMYKPTEQDWDDVMFDDSREEPNLEYDEMSDSLLSRGDKVMLFGKYPATVAEDEDPDNDRIRLTNPDTFGTQEEDSYTDWFKKDDVDRSKDLWEGKASLGDRWKHTMKHSFSKDRLAKGGKTIAKALGGDKIGAMKDALDMEKDQLKFAYDTYTGKHDNEINNTEDIQESMKKNTIKLTEDQMRSRIYGMVKKSLMEAMGEMGGMPMNEPVDGESEEMTPEFIANSLIEEIQDFMEDKSPNTRAMRMAMDLDKVQKLEMDPSRVYRWIEHTLSAHPELDSVDAVLDYMLGGIREGMLPHKNFAQNFFTKEARDMYFSKADLKHRSKDEIAKAVENDPSLAKQTRQGKYWQKKAEAMKGGDEGMPAGLAESIARRVMNALRNS